MTTTDHAVHEALPDIPGLHLRRLRGAADYEPMAALQRAAARHDREDYMPDAASLQVEFEHTTDLVPERDVVLVEADGELVALAWVMRQVRDGLAVYTAMGTVHPEWRRRGIGRALLRRNEAHARLMAERFDDPDGRVLGAWASEREREATRLLESEGYQAVRWYFSMRRPNLDDLPQVALPDGLELRPVRDEDVRPIFDADNEAFRDHWGHREQTEEDFQSILALPDHDPSLWSVAWDGEEVAGSVRTVIWRTENEELGVRRGWLEHISVRRRWRRRGVARALIVDSLRRLAAAGMDEAMLGVDADNPTGALQLYEGLGFEPKDRASTYRKPWEPGGRLI